MLNLSTALLAFAISITASAISHAFNEPLRFRAVCGAHVSQSGEGINESQEIQIPESNNTGCLNPNIPRPKVSVHFGVLNTRATDIPRPAWPRAARIQGTVIAHVVVNETGRVIWARLTSGHTLLQAEVRRVVCRARFEPVRVSGHPVRVSGIITYRFVLE
jgi:TonB family protein